MIDERAAAARLIEGSNVKKNPLAPIVDHPWRVLGATLLVTMGLGYFMQFVAPSITFKDMLGPDYPGLADYEYVQSEFTKDDNALVMIEAQDASTLHHRIPTGAVRLRGGCPLRPSYGSETPKDLGTRRFA